MKHLFLICLSLISMSSISQMTNEERNKNSIVIKTITEKTEFWSDKIDKGEKLDSLEIIEFRSYEKIIDSLEIVYNTQLKYEENEKKLHNKVQKTFFYFLVGIVFAVGIVIIVLILLHFKTK